MGNNLIRDRHGNLLGWTTSFPSGNQMLYDQHGNLLGRYEVYGNITLDQHGNLVGPGNLLMMCLGADNRR